MTQDKMRTSQPGLGLINPLRDSLNDIFTPDVISAWKNCRHPSEDLKFRLEILEASGPCPSDPMQADRLRFLMARRTSWGGYLDVAHDCGMFEGERDRDLRARLTGTDDNNFRSAMAECEVCWFLANRMGLKVEQKASGISAKKLDMKILLEKGEIGVEVKAPFRQPPQGIYCGDDADKIADSLNAANKQFNHDIPNILVIVPTLKKQLFISRRELIKAAYGEDKITFLDNTQTGKDGQIEYKFSPEGKFFNTQRPGGQPLKQDGFPAYRRVSSILCIEEKIVERDPFSSENNKWIGHDVLVLHNPFAYHPISLELFRDFPQFVPVENEMRWTDGYNRVW